MARKQRLSWKKPLLTVGTVSTWNGLSHLESSEPLVDLIEVRLDALFAKDRSPENIIKILKKRKTNVILTLRTRDEGGLYSWKSTERVLIFEQLLPYVDVIDIELKNVHYHRDILRSARSKGKSIILSAHSLSRKLTPRKAARWMSEFKKHRANVYKIASLARNCQDLGLLTRLVLENRSNMAVMATGKMSQVSRVVLSALGSKLVYGYLDEPMATGQPPVEEIRTMLDPIGLV
ncbi:MAG: type I 3-dehydroquinate dehydratase [Verrucomicrobiota bacterium]